MTQREATPTSAPGQAPASTQAPASRSAPAQASANKTTLTIGQNNQSDLNISDLKKLRCDFSDRQTDIATKIINILSVGKGEEEYDAEHAILSNQLSEYFVEMVVPLLMEIKQSQRERERDALSKTNLLDFEDSFHKIEKYSLSTNHLLNDIVTFIKRLLDYDNTKSFYVDLIQTMENDETEIFNFLNVEPDAEKRDSQGRMAESLFEYMKYNRFITLINGGRMITSRDTFNFIFKNQDQLDNNIIIMIDLNVIALHLFFSLVDNIYDACTLLICIMTQSLDSYKALNLFDYNLNDSIVNQPFFN